MDQVLDRRLEGPGVGRLSAVVDVKQESGSSRETSKAALRGIIFIDPERIIVPDGVCEIEDVIAGYFVQEALVVQIHLDADAFSVLASNWSRVVIGLCMAKAPW